MTAIEGALVPQGEAEMHLLRIMILELSLMAVMAAVVLVAHAGRAST